MSTNVVRMNANGNMNAGMNTAVNTGMNAGHSDDQKLGACLYLHGQGNNGVDTDGFRKCYMEGGYEALHDKCQKLGKYKMKNHHGAAPAHAAAAPNNVNMTAAAPNNINMTAARRVNSNGNSSGAQAATVAVVEVDNAQSLDDIIGNVTDMLQDGTMTAGNGNGAAAAGAAGEGDQENYWYWGGYGYRWGWPGYRRWYGGPYTYGRTYYYW